MKKLSRLLVLFGITFCLQACDNDDSFDVTPPVPPAPTAMASFDVTVDNLTNAQPLSPIAVIGHRSGYSVFTVGTAATAGLEQLAEGGDNTMLLAEANADANVLTSGGGTAAIGPAGSQTVTITVLESDLATLAISAATMLVNTNDAFSALNGISVASMMVGETMEFRTIAYDAGTEADTEIAAEIPGPAGGGEGLNVARSDDADRVSMHAGVLSQNDGLAGSDLSEQHRFDNPVMRVRIFRTQ